MRQVEEAAQAAEWSNTDTRVLMLLYSCLMDAAASATRHFCAQPDADAQSARAAAAAALASAAAERGCSGSLAGDGAAKLRLALWSCDHLNAVNSSPSPANGAFNVWAAPLSAPHFPWSHSPRRGDPTAIPTVSFPSSAAYRKPSDVLRAWWYLCVACAGDAP